MKKDILVGIIVFVVALLLGGYAVFFEGSDSGYVIPMFMFPVLILPYFYYTQYSILNKILFNVFYWTTILLVLVTVLTSGMAIADFGDGALFVVALAIMGGFVMVFVLFVGYIIVFIDSNNNGQDFMVLFIVLAVITVGVLLLGDYPMIPQIMYGIFIPLSGYTIYRLYLRGY